MQNNVTDLSQKLQRSLDNNYNVIDMPAVVEIISTLEKTTVTKELLETTRLGKYINELRRRTTNESLAKRAKDLVKKWRGLILPEANGQIKAASISNERSNSPDVSQLKNRKRPNKDKTDVNAKRSVLNGQREFDFSDNSNCSVKDLKKTEVIFINSDSNSSIPEQSNDSFTAANRTQPPETFEEAAPQPKKRGRKKGSKNHKNLIVAAEESFSNKLSAISRNSKVKTTQELLADLQNRTVKPDIELRAAQLTENLSRIEQKLNPQKKINTNVQPIKKEPIKNDTKPNSIKTEPIEDVKFTKIKQENDAGSSRVSTPDVVIVPSDDEIVDVVGDTPIPPSEVPKSEPLTIEGILSKLPTIDHAALEEPDEFPLCTCPVPVCEDNITVQIVGEEKKEPYSSIFSSSPTHEEETFKPIKSDTIPDEIDECVINCPTRLFLQDKYKLESVSDSSYETLKNKCLPNVNGNDGLKTENQEQTIQDNGLYVNIVPNLSSLRKDLSTYSSYLPSENYNKYSISINDLNTSISSNNCDTVNTEPSDNVCKDITFREWHETLDIESYNGETLRILPYVIID